MRCLFSRLISLHLSLFISMFYRSVFQRLQWFLLLIHPICIEKSWFISKMNKLIILIWCSKAVVLEFLSIHLINLKEQNLSPIQRFDNLVSFESNRTDNLSDINFKHFIWFFSQIINSSDDHELHNLSFDSKWGRW